MKKLIKIISAIPCYLKANNEIFFVEKSIYLEIFDEEEIFLNLIPYQNCNYLPIFYNLNSKISYHKNVRITTYKNNILLEFYFNCVDKVKYYSNEDFSISCYNDYFLNYDNEAYLLKNFNRNYYKFDIIELNSRYSIIKGFFKLTETIDYDAYNQKINIAIFDKSTKSIIHFDSCNKVEITKDTLKIISLMFDQNKQALISEFNISNNDFSKKDFYSVYTNKKPSNLTKKYQISKAFFECILSNNIQLITSYLTDDLKSIIKNKNLHLMFDNFVKVDNEFLQNIDEVNLICKVSENIYKATTYKIEYIQNKISNIVSINK